jgi:hypothetical protein
MPGVALKLFFACLSAKLKLSSTARSFTRQRSEMSYLLIVPINADYRPVLFLSFSGIGVPKIPGPTVGLMPCDSWWRAPASIPGMA